MKHLIVGNWKMAPASAREAKQLFLAVKKSTTSLRSTQAVLCPPFLYLSALAQGAKGERLVFGAQDASLWDEDAHTGDISPVMLAGAGAKYVIVGHSERRSAGDTDDMVNKKTRAVLSEGLRVILCVGERERDEHGEYAKHIAGQVRSALAGVSRAHLSRIVIAYEPVWAIGKHATASATPADFLEVSIVIKKTLVELYGKDGAEHTPILYGGSVNEKNSEGFLAEGGADGLLVGRASLNAVAFSAILTIADTVARAKKHL